MLTRDNWQTLERSALHKVQLPCTLCEEVTEPRLQTVRRNLHIFFFLSVQFVGQVGAYLP